MSWDIEYFPLILRASKRVSMHTYEYLDAIQRQIGTNSDNSVAQILGVSRQAVSRYRSGMGHFDDEISTKVAEVLNLHPGIVLLDMYAERTKNEATKNLWKEISAGFYTLLPHAKSVRMVSLHR